MEFSNKADRPKVLVISVISSGYNSGNKAKISINDSEVIMVKNESNHFRGLHIVLINASNGKIHFSKVFDTY